MVTFVIDPSRLSLIAVALLCAEASASDQDLRETIVSGGRERSYRVFVPDGFGKNGPGPAVVLFNGSGSNVDGLMDPWKDIARKEGVLLIGPGAFQPGAWRIPEDSPDFTSEVVQALEAEVPDRSPPCLPGRSFRRRRPRPVARAARVRILRRGGRACGRAAAG